MQYKWYIGSALAALAIAGGAFYAYKQVSRTSSSSNSASAAANAFPLATSTPQTTEVSQGERSYQSHAFHFSVVYPDNLAATEYKEQDNALTVTFQDPTTNEGFEVYVTPYSGTQITEARFKLDEPSGTYLQPTNIVIDGTPATMFYGHNAIMGDTREVWFIKDGYLYEVATYKQLDSWLSQTMATWQFI